ncbi:MAG: hypothetical protein LBN10_06945 [Propionibacteriaceae bacterium]|jgi:hypothetical protein|nr:hypothetical protein [Propionibacteriaceae bacterium]
MDASSAAVVLIAMIAVIFVPLAVLKIMARRQVQFQYRLPQGATVAQTKDSIVSALPAGWKPLGTAKSDASFLAEEGTEEWAIFLNLRQGLLGPKYIVSVELSTSITDAYGRTSLVPFTQAEPQQEYTVDIWVSYMYGGLGKIWFWPTSLKIIGLKKYLAEKFGVVADA